MSGFSDASIAADEVRRYSRMIGFRREDSVYGTPGQLALDERADLLLVSRVRDRPEQRDGDRLELDPLQLRQDRDDVRLGRGASRPAPSDEIRSGTSNVRRRGMYGSG